MLRYFNSIHILSQGVTKAGFVGQYRFALNFAHIYLWTVTFCPFSLVLHVFQHAIISRVHTPITLKTLQVYYITNDARERHTIVKQRNTV